MFKLKKLKPENHIFLWLCCVIFHIFQNGIRISLSNVLNNELREYFHIGSKELGTLFGIAYMVYAVMQLPVGAIIDRLNTRIIAAISCFLMSVGIFLLAVTNIFYIGFFSQIILYFGASFAFLIALKVTNTCFSSDKVDLISSIVISCGCFGPVVFGLLTAYLSKFYNWTGIVFGFSICCLLLSICILFSKNSTYSDLNKKQMNVIESFKSILSDKNIVFAGIFSMFMLGTSSTFSEVWGVSFIKANYCVDTVKATSIISMYFFGLILGSPFFAFLSKILKSYKKAMLLGSISMFITLLLIVFVKSSLVILNLLLFLFGFFSASQMLSFLLAAKLTEKNIVGSVTGVVNTITMFGAAMFVPLVSAIIDYSKGTNIAYSSIDYQFGMIPLFVSLIIAIIIINFIKENLVID